MVASSFNKTLGGLPSILKDPAGLLDYIIDWSDWLAGDTITGATWTVAPTGALAVNTSNFSATKSTVWLQGGTAGSRFTVTGHIQTAGGRQESRSFSVQCQVR